MLNRDHPMVLFLSERQSGLLWPTLGPRLARIRRRRQRQRLLSVVLALLALLCLAVLVWRAGLIGRIAPWAGPPP